METQDDTFETCAPADDVLAKLLPRRLTLGQRRFGAELPVNNPVVATLVEFSREDHPVVSAGALLAGERLVARSSVALKQAHLGCSVVVLCENGDPRLPIIVGVIGLHSREPAAESASGKHAVIQADGERYVVDAEREIVLRCGESSITLTRAGKVIIKGKYILSRSSGYNKIKGAAVDIN